MQSGTVMCPGAFNALVARQVAGTGFQACYVSGAATANSAGLPDIGLVTREAMTRTMTEIVVASGLPVIADADTGFGDAAAAADSLSAYESAGVAGMHVEDQVFPKRCGHLEGKELIPAEDMEDKIRAMAGRKQDPDFLLIARTDARSVTGMEDALDRACRYREAGADMIFPEGLESEEEFSQFAGGSPGLLMANMTEFGRTPQLTLARFEELGYALVIYPLSMLRLAMGHVTEGLRLLKEEGSTTSLLSAMQTRSELYALLGYDPSQPWEA